MRRNILFYSILWAIIQGFEAVLNSYLHFVTIYVFLISTANFVIKLKKIDIKVHYSKLKIQHFINLWQKTVIKINKIRFKELYSLLKIGIINNFFQPHTCINLKIKTWRFCLLGEEILKKNKKSKIKIGLRGWKWVGEKVLGI